MNTKESGEQVAMQLGTKDKQARELRDAALQLTREAVTIAASKKLTFAPAKALKDRL